MKKNILLITKDFYPNNTGFANATINLVKSVSKYSGNKIQFHVFTDVPLNGREELKLTNCIVLRYKSIFPNKDNNPLILVRNFLIYLYLKRYILENKIDFILFETNIHHVLINLLTKTFNDKVGVRLHSTIDTEVLMYFPKSLPGRILKILTLKAMRDIKYVICTNPYHLKFVKEKLFANNEYWIWNNKEYFLLPNTLFLEENDIKVSDGGYLFTLGKMSSQGYIQKGLIDLVKAVYWLKENKKLPINFKLKVVGSGEKQKELVNLVNKLGVGHLIEIISRTTHKETLELISNAKAILLASRYEGQSMFLTEALCLGKPIITTKDTGVSHMVEDGKNGFLIKKGNYEDIAQKMVKIYQLSDKEIKSMGHYSKNLFDHQFSPKKINDLLSNILKFVD